LFTFCYIFFPIYFYLFSQQIVAMAAPAGKLKPALVFPFSVVVFKDSCVNLNEKGAMWRCEGNVVDVLCSCDCTGKLDDSKVASPQPAEEEKTTTAAAAAAAATVPTGGDDSEAGVPPNPFDFSAMTGLLNVMLLQSFLFPT
jgi:hypothetical protein